MSELNTESKTNRAHALLSPSGSVKWMGCPSAPAMEASEVDEITLTSATGTAAHFLAAEGFLAWDGDIPKSVVGQEIVVLEDSGDAQWENNPERATPVAFIIEITPDMLEKVQGYVDTISALAAGRTLLVEQRMDISFLTGEEGAKGTADAVIYASDENRLEVHDLKYGHVEVLAENNSQLMIYALAAYEVAGGEFSGYDTVRLGIHQPNLHTSDYWDCSAEDLLEFGGWVKESAELSLTILADSEPVHAYNHTTPGDHCKKGYCKARGSCRKLAEHVQEHCDFDKLPLTPSDITHLTPAELGVLRSKTKLVKDWADHIDTRVASTMKSGTAIPGYKLVKGQDGKRTWKDEEAVEGLMVKSMKIKHDVAYKKVLISPTAAAAAAKEGLIGPRQWPRLQAQITRAPGGLTVAPVSDKREAVDVSPPSGDEFEVLVEEELILVDIKAVVNTDINESEFY